MSEALTKREPVVVKPDVLEWHGAVDRHGWGPGPWDGEPDKRQWEFEGTACLAVRGPSGAWCGYAGVPEGHPLYGLHYSDPSPHLGEQLSTRLGQPMLENEGLGVLLACLSGSAGASPDVVFHVHGGITYSGACQEGDPATTICHVAPPGAAPVWWFGFDCAHSGDLMPRHAAEFPRAFERGTYRTLEYVIEEVHGLARELRAVQRATLPPVSPSGGGEEINE